MAEGGAHPLIVDRGDVLLDGTLWAPAGDGPRALVVMHPGSGPSDRDNDGYFPPIREILLEASCAVASFDKRGVGRSSGDWRRASIEQQAEDVLAAVAMIHSRSGDTPIGVFGHSQGGWVVAEAASRRERVEFVIVNSGPGVSPASQERYAAWRSLQEGAASVEDHMGAYDTMVHRARSGARFDEVGAEGAAFLPDGTGAAEWEFWKSILDYDPSSALERIDVPVLALWGGDDRVVPVEESIEAFRAAVSPGLLTVEVFPGADHRIQVGEPPGLAPGYAERLRAFLDQHL